MKASYFLETAEHEVKILKKSTKNTNHPQNLVMSYKVIFSINLEINYKNGSNKITLRLFGNMQTGQKIFWILFQHFPWNAIIISNDLKHQSRNSFKRPNNTRNWYWHSGWCNNNTDRKCSSVSFININNLLGRTMIRPKKWEMTYLQRW